jgi:hypothetical protein
MFAGISGSNPAEGVDVLLLYMLCGCVGSGLCDELITRSEESTGCVLGGGVCVIGYINNEAA